MICYNGIIIGIVIMDKYWDNFRRFIKYRFLNTKSILGFGDDLGTPNHRLEPQFHWGCHGN